MKIRDLVLLAVAVTLAGSTVLFADVKSQERTKVQFEGALGRVVNLFSGRAAHDGIVNTIALKGDRMLSTNETTGEIVDLREEKVTASDLRRAAQAVDFSITESGRTRQIAGYETIESIATVTVREKGKTVEEAGGLIMETALWLAPEIHALNELQAFRLRYAQQVYGPVMTEAAPTMAQAMAMYPMMRDAMARFQAEGQKLSGTALSTEMKDQLQAPPQSARDQPQAEPQKREDPPPTTVGGLLGGIGRRMARRKPDEKKDEPNAASGRAPVMTTTTETLQVQTSVTDADVALPAGFKEQ